MRAGKRTMKRLHERRLRALSADLKRFEPLYNEHGKLPADALDTIERQLRRMQNV